MTYQSQGASASFTPALKGATQDPSSVTYSTQMGQYIVIGKLCWFTVKLVTTSITKSTLTDALRISLPFTAVNNGSQTVQCSGRMENGTPVQNANTAYIAPNTAYLTMGQLTATVARADITYALLSLGVLTNTITFEASGIYEIV